MSSSLMSIRRPAVIWFLIFYNCFSAIGVMFFVPYYMFSSSAPPNRLQYYLSPTISTTILLMATLLGLFLILVSYGLYTRKKWSRIAQLILAIFNILSFPIGTMYAIIALTQLNTKSGKEYFDIK